MSIDTVSCHNYPFSGNFNISDKANTFPTKNNEVYSGLDTQFSALSIREDSSQLLSSTNGTFPHNIYPQMSNDTVSCHNCPFSGNLNPSDNGNTCSSINNEVNGGLETQFSVLSMTDDSSQLSCSTNVTSSHNISFPQMSVDTVSCHNCPLCGNFSLSDIANIFPTENNEVNGSLDIQLALSTPYQVPWPILHPPTAPRLCKSFSSFSIINW